jgi:chloramphenicol-sensitive protein RarD
MTKRGRAGSLAGAAYALAAYGSWGFFPVYFKTVREVPALVVLAHRVVWSAAFMLPLVIATGRARAVWGAVRAPGVLRTLACSTGLIAANWLVYIWAIAAGRVVEASLGYFLNPFVNVALGALFLRERLSTRQAVAVALALAGVIAMVAGSGVLPWVSLALALTFSLYGLLRKTVGIDAAGGLLVETLLLLPAAAAFLLLPLGVTAGGAGLGAWRMPVLVFAGPMTALPLLWFARAARRLPLGVLGFFQFVSPTLQLLLGVLAYGEAFTRVHAASFALIWAGVALYLLDSFGARHKGGEAGSGAD